MNPETPGVNIPVDGPWNPIRESLFYAAQAAPVAVPRRLLAQSGRVFFYLLAIVLAVAITGCATILRSPTPNTLHITSKPDTAQVIVNGRVYTTPATIELPSAPRYILECRKAGYLPMLDTVETSVGTGWLVADILFSFPAFGAPVAFDALFGQWYVIDEENARIHFALPPAPPGTHPQNPATAVGDSTTFHRDQSRSQNLALLVEVGVAMPVYQLPVVPTSYSAGFSFSPARWCTLSLRQEIHGSAAPVPSFNTTGSVIAPESSLFVLAPVLDFRLAPWDALYIAGGTGIMNATVGTGSAHATTSWLPLASAGIGYVFPGGKWFIDIRRTTALSTMYVPSSGTVFRPAYTTARLGLRLLLAEY